MATNISVISCKNVTKLFLQGTTNILILNLINQDFFLNKSYVIMGVSGTGKSTFMHMLAGLEKPTSGHICFDNTDINKLTDREKQLFLLNKIGLIFQSPYLIKELSVIENIMLKGLISGQDYASAQDRALYLLDKIQLSGKAHMMPGVLSGGEQQRVAIARALFTRPAVLLADEPTAHLDESSRDTIINLLLSCQKEWSMGLIIASHDSYVAKQMDDILELRHGKLHAK